MEAAAGGGAGVVGLETLTGGIGDAALGAGVTDFEGGANCLFVTGAVDVGVAGTVAERRYA